MRRHNFTNLEPSGNFRVDFHLSALFQLISTNLDHPNWHPEVVLLIRTV